MIFLDLERYLHENARGARPCSWQPPSLRIGCSEWSMAADDLQGAVDSAIEAHRAWNRVRA